MKTVKKTTYKAKKATTVNFTLLLLVSTLAIGGFFLIALMNIKAIISCKFDYLTTISSIVISLITGITVAYTYEDRVRRKEAQYWYEYIPVETAKLHIDLGKISVYGECYVRDRIYTLIYNIDYHGIKYKSILKKDNYDNLTVLKKICMDYLTIISSESKEKIDTSKLLAIQVKICKSLGHED